MQTTFIRYRYNDGTLFEEGGRWLPMDFPSPSFEKTGMALNEWFATNHSDLPEDAPKRIVAVDRMVWKSR